jgi:hypothetical protein
MDPRFREDDQAQLDHFLAAGAAACPVSNFAQTSFLSAPTVFLLPRLVLAFDFVLCP